MLPSEWSGDVEVIRTSAMTGEGLDNLLETLLVTAELHEYKANPDRDAMGTCLEAELVSIAGIYRTSEIPLPAEVLGKSAQVRLISEKLVMEAL